MPSISRREIYLFGKLIARLIAAFSRKLPEMSLPLQPGNKSPFWLPDNRNNVNQLAKNNLIG